MEERHNIKKKNKRPTYEPPRAVDLSDSRVSGQVPPACSNNGQSPASTFRNVPKPPPPK